MKDFEKTKFCLDLNIEHFLEGIFFIKKCTLKKSWRVFIDKAHPLISLMTVWLLDWKNIISVLLKWVKIFLLLKYHILVQLVLLYILKIVHG